MKKIGFIFIATVALIFSCCGERDRKPSDFDVWGIDLSKHQKHVNWETLSKEGNKPHFVFLKATEGLIIEDPFYEARKKEAEKRNILVGAYHFFGHRTPGADQAEFFIKKSNLKKGNLRPVLDIEHHRFMTDPKKMVKEAKSFCKKIKSHYGVYPIIYCSSGFYNHYLSKDFKKGDYVLWIADYSKHPPVKWDIWQHTDSHRMKAIRGKVDRNVFDGDEEDLKDLIL